MSAFKFKGKIPEGVKVLDDKKAQDNNITEQHMKAFKAIRDPKYDNFALYSCFLDGKPTAAIVSINDDEDDPEGQVAVSPLFVAVTADMKITNHQGVDAEYYGPKESIQ